LMRAATADAMALLGGGGGAGGGVRQVERASERTRARASGNDETGRASVPRARAVCEVRRLAFCYVCLRAKGGVERDVLVLSGRGLSLVRAGSLSQSARRVAERARWRPSVSATPTARKANRANREERTLQLLLLSAAIIAPSYSTSRTQPLSLVLRPANAAREFRSWGLGLLHVRLIRRGERARARSRPPRLLALDVPPTPCTASRSVRASVGVRGTRD